MSYNGYRNYETWAVCLWIDNEEGSYNYWKDRAQEIYDDKRDDGLAHDEAIEETITDLAETLEAEHDEANPITGASVFSDLLTAALGEVDWREVAQTRCEEIEQPEPEGDETDEPEPQAASSAS